MVSCTVAVCRSRENEIYLGHPLAFFHIPVFKSLPKERSGKAAKLARRKAEIRNMMHVKWREGCFREFEATATQTSKQVEEVYWASCKELRICSKHFHPKVLYIKRDGHLGRLTGSAPTKVLRNRDEELNRDRLLIPTSEAYDIDGINESGSDKRLLEVDEAQERATKHARLSEMQFDEIKRVGATEDAIKCFSDNKFNLPRLK